MGHEVGCRHMKSVYPTLVLGFLKSGSFNITVKDESTIGASGMITMLEYALRCSLNAISYGVRLRVARSTVMGTCQSLKKRDE